MQEHVRNLFLLTLVTRVFFFTTDSWDDRVNFINIHIFPISQMIWSRAYTQHKMWYKITTAVKNGKSCQRSIKELILCQPEYQKTLTIKKRSRPLLAELGYTRLTSLFTFILPTLNDWILSGFRLKRLFCRTPVHINHQFIDFFCFYTVKHFYKKC